MKRAVSISIGSSRRNKAVEVDLLGEKVSIERIGTDGDMEKAAQLYRELDGKVDAFGVGGADLGIMVDRRWYPLYSVASMVRYVKKTPIVDGTGLKTTLESLSAQVIDAAIGPYMQQHGCSAFLITAVDRWGMARSFWEAGYDCTCGDLMFTLGIPLPLYKPAQLKFTAALVMPIAGRIPFKWVYPTGKEQEKRTPKWEKYFTGNTVIAGDCHYIRRYMPERMDNKVIVTNTTTKEDIDIFRQAGVHYLLTTTPVLDGRSFGTNMMEAAILAATGRRDPVDYRHADAYLEELAKVLDCLNFKPQLQELN